MDVVVDAAAVDLANNTWNGCSPRVPNWDIAQ